VYLTLVELVNFIEFVEFVEFVEFIEFLVALKTKRKKCPRVGTKWDSGPKSFNNHGLSAHRWCPIFVPKRDKKGQFKALLPGKEGGSRKSRWSIKESKPKTRNPKFEYIDLRNDKYRLY
jgi:hypothetical protein